MDIRKLGNKLKYHVVLFVGHQGLERNDLRVMFQASGAVGDVFLQDMSYEQYENLHETFFSPPSANNQSL